MEELLRQLLENGQLIEAEMARMALLRTIRSHSNLFLVQNLRSQAPDIYEEIKKLHDEYSMKLDDALDYMQDLLMPNKLYSLLDQRQKLESQLEALQRKPNSSNQQQASEEEKEEEDTDDLETQGHAGNHHKDGDGDNGDSGNCNAGPGSNAAPQGDPGNDSNGYSDSQGDIQTVPETSEKAAENSEAEMHFSALFATALNSALYGFSLHHAQAPGAPYMPEFSPLLVGTVLFP